jgi:predicted DNA-binding transcriptional regulator AlpA
MQTIRNETEKKRGFLRLPQVLEILPISKSTWWKGIKEGRFPKPVKLTERTSAWLRADIDALCDQFIASRLESSSNEGKGF